MFSTRSWLRQKTKRTVQLVHTEDGKTNGGAANRDETNIDDSADFLDELKRLRNHAETRLSAAQSAKVLAGLDAIIDEFAAAHCDTPDTTNAGAISQASYCGMKLDMSISPGPSRCDASSVAAQAAQLVQSLSSPEDGKTDEAAGPIKTGQPTMSVSNGPNCQTAAANTAAEALDILKALQRQDK